MYKHIYTYMYMYTSTYVVAAISKDHGSCRNCMGSSPQGEHAWMRCDRYCKALLDLRVLQLALCFQLLPVIGWVCGQFCGMLCRAWYADEATPHETLSLASGELLRTERCNFGVPHERYARRSPRPYWKRHAGPAQIFFSKATYSLDQVWVGKTGSATKGPVISKHPASWLQTTSLDIKPSGSRRPHKHKVPSVSFFIPDKKDSRNQFLVGYLCLRGLLGFCTKVSDQSLGELHRGRPHSVLAGQRPLHLGEGPFLPCCGPTESGVPFLSIFGS